MKGLSQGHEAQLIKGSKLCSCALPRFTVNCPSQGSGIRWLVLGPQTKGDKPFLLPLHGISYSQNSCRVVGLQARKLCYTQVKGLGVGSVGERLPSMHQLQGLMHSTEGKTN